MAARRRREPAVSAEARKLFLEAFAAGWSVTEASKRAGVARQRFYDLAKVDERFAAEWVEADAMGLDFVRDEIRRRAIDGWDEPVYQQGELAGYIRRKSDRLLELEAKRRDPAYRERAALELSGTARFEIDANVQVDYDFPAIVKTLRDAGVFAIAGLEDNADLLAIEAGDIELGDDGAAPTSNGDAA